MRSITRHAAWITLISLPLLYAAAGGSLSGTISDASGASVAHAQLRLVNTDLKTEFKAASDAKGFYSFPSLPVGQYNLRVEAAGFGSQEKTSLTVDADAAVRVDLRLEVGQRSDTVTVSAADSTIETQVDTVATHLGEIVTEKQIEAIPLNGRSYTDLLAIQPGVSPSIHRET
jgi:hypothetical protein